MELVAMDMKQRGVYIARQLSFHGVTFKIEEVLLSENFRQAYDNSVELVSFKCQKICLNAIFGKESVPSSGKKLSSIEIFN